MRLDKYLKVSRIIKRRTVANEACDKGHVSINGKIGKPSTEVKVGDKLTIQFGANSSSFIVKSLDERTGKADAAGMYELINE